MNSKIQLKAETVTMGDLIVAITDAALEVVGELEYWRSKSLEIIQ